MDVESVKEPINQEQAGLTSQRPGDRESGYLVGGERQTVGGQRRGHALRQPRHTVRQTDHFQCTTNVGRGELVAANPHVFRYCVGKGLSLAHIGQLESRGGAVERAGVDPVEFEQTFAGHPKQPEQFKQEGLAASRGT